MTRLEQLRSAVDAMIEAMPEAEARRKFYVHLYGVSKCAALLAARRNLDQELASVTGMLHDISAVSAGSYEDHCRQGSIMARSMLETQGGYSPEETDAICNAILMHDARGGVHDPYTELLIDADILEPWLLHQKDPSDPPTMSRLMGIQQELKI